MLIPPMSMLTGAICIIYYLIFFFFLITLNLHKYIGDVLSVIVIVVGNEISDLSSNLGCGCLRFTLC